MTDTKMGEALIQYKRENGHVAMRKLLQDVAGVNSISEVPADKVAAITAACGTSSAMKGKPDFNSPDFVSGVYARWNGTAN